MWHLFSMDMNSAYDLCKTQSISLFLQSLPRVMYQLLPLNNSGVWLKTDVSAAPIGQEWFQARLNNRGFPNWGIWLDTSHFSVFKSTLACEKWLDWATAQSKVTGTECNGEYTLALTIVALQNDVSMKSERPGFVSHCCLPPSEGCPEGNTLILCAPLLAEKPLGSTYARKMRAGETTIIVSKPHGQTRGNQLLHKMGLGATKNKIKKLTQKRKKKLVNQN